MSHRIVIVGAGGVGGWLLKSVGRIVNTAHPDSVVVVVDGDSYEPKNKDRQEFRQYGNKALVKAEETAPLFEDIFLVAEERWVGGEETVTDEVIIKASDLLRENDVVFAAVDNYAARKDIFEAAGQLDNVDVFSGGNDEALFGSTYHYQRRNGKDVTDPPKVWHEEFENPPDRNPAVLSCEERAELDGGTQTVAANMMVAGMLTARFHHTIIEENHDEAAEIMFDAALGMSQPYDRLVEEANVPALTQ